MNVLTEEEFNTLSKYINGGILAAEDKDVIYNSGLASTGFHENPDGTIVETASVGYFGIRFIELMRISKNKLKSLYFRILTWFY